ncbi:MAG: L-lactate permease [Lachnospiraceae bacterium]|nr:L-lactate permease [Lachnospiraceae bacterium]
MNLPMNPFFWVMALVPVLFLLITIMKFGWGVARAAPAGMVLALGTAVLFYRSSPVALLYESGKGIWNAVTILLVVWPAVFSYELTCQSRGFDAIRRGVQDLTRHELLQILILGWIFPSFLQGITGFGVAVAVGAPLLLSIGVNPLYSIIIVLLCHSWGATFGTLALAWEALAEQSGVAGGEAARAAFLAAAMIWFSNFVGVCLSCWFYGRWKALKEIAPVAVLLTLMTGGGELLLAPVNATISNFLPSAAALFATFLLCRIPHYQRSWRLEGSPIIKEQKEAASGQTPMTFHEAFLPYYVLTLVTVICLLIPPVNRLLGQWRLGFAFPETVTGFGYVTGAEHMFSPMKPLTYAGTFLALSAGISGICYCRKGYLDGSGVRAAALRTAKKCISPTIAITCFIIMSRFMGSSGQIHVLSQGIVSVLGRYYVLAAPFLGILGTFITSSNMSANILLGNFQMTAATFLGIRPAVTLALQTAGGVLGTAFSPGCVLMGISTTGMAGAEGEILRRIVPVAAGCGAVFGIVAFLFLI